MKLRTWLLATYLLVMLVPLVAAYVLFAWISDYNKERAVADRLETMLALQNIQRITEKTALYYPQADYRAVKALGDETQAITLYDASGKVLYTTNPFLAKTASAERFHRLNELQRDFRTYTYRAPVLEERAIIGFYEVVFSRKQWRDGVANRTTTVIVLFSLVLLIVYALVIVITNRKFTKRLSLLGKQMSAFAQNKPFALAPKTYDEIGELTEQFYAMQREVMRTRKKLTQEQAEKQFMIASLSHDLKTPLTAIRAYAESLQGNLSAAERAEYEQIIISKSHYMQQMLDDLTTYTTLQSPNYALTKVAVDGEEYFEMLLSDYQALCANRGIQLTTHNAAYGTYYLNPKQLMRVMDNAMMNAIQHAATKVSAFTAEADAMRTLVYDGIAPYITDGALYIVVQNDGEGIREEDAKHVFDPLYQADVARTKAGDRGSGLGLSITKQIIEKHGGTVQIVSAKTIGTALICRLPLKEETP